MKSYWTGLFVFLCSFTSAVSQAPEFSYDLKPGDHLIYRYRFNRKVDNRGALEEKDLYGQPLFEPLHFEENLEWKTHLLVISSGDEGLRVGIQRNLVEARLEHYERSGADLLDSQRPLFHKRAEARKTFAEANIIGWSGHPRLPWSAVREWTSKLLFEFHELLPLPPGAVHPGYTWSTGGLRPVAYSVQGRREAEGEDCMQVQAQAGSNSQAEPYDLSLTYLFCPQSGVLREVEGGAAYTGLTLEGNQETVAIELLERRRDEQISNWLKDPDLSEAVLEAMLLPGSKVDAASLTPLLRSSQPPRIQRRALAILYQRRLGVPEQLLTPLLESPDAEIRRIAKRVALDPVPVRSSGEQTDSAFAGEEMEASPGAATPSADIPSLFGQPALDACRIPGNWATPRPAQRLGTYFTAMTSPGVEGWPLAVQIPIDYRGDEAFPLIINLAGNGGTAMEGIQASQAGLESSEYIVVYPHAGDFWWKEQPMKVIGNLLSEIHRRYKVDPNRVYLTGWSNGGTATFHFASHWPHYLAAAVPIMGAGFWAPGMDLQEDVVAENVGNLPMLFLHGEEDRTIPARESRETVRRLIWRRAPLEEHYFPNLGHELAPGAQDEGRTVAFFQRFTRNPFPRFIRVGMHHLKFPRHYWVEILSGEATIPGVDGTFHVEGEIGDDNTIRLKTRNVRSFRLLLRPELFPQSGPIRVIVNDREVYSGALPHDCQVLQESFEATQDPYLAYSGVLTFELGWTLAQSGHSETVK